MFLVTSGQSTTILARFVMPAMEIMVTGSSAAAKVSRRKLMAERSEMSSRQPSRSEQQRPSSPQ